MNEQPTSYRNFNYSDGSASIIVGLVQCWWLHPQLGLVAAYGNSNFSVVE